MIHLYGNAEQIDLKLAIVEKIIKIQRKVIQTPSEGCKEFDQSWKPLKTMDWTIGLEERFWPLRHCG